MIRKGDAGMGLVGSRVQVTTGKVCRWGTVHSYDTHTQIYHIELQDRTQVTLNHEQVTKHWRPATSHSSWTREDQTQLGIQIRKIVGLRTVDVERQLRNPHPTLLQSTTWMAKETWYTCEMSYAFPIEYKELFAKRRSHEMDLRIETKLCEDRVVFWAPREVWDWQSTSASNRAGWFVQAMATYEKAEG